jgi:hypothetical protein
MAGARQGGCIRELGRYAQIGDGVLTVTAGMRRGRRCHRPRGRLWRELKNLVQTPKNHFMPSTRLVRILNSDLPRHPSDSLKFSALLCQSLTITFSNP